jgi:hypothetical protein
MAGERVEIVLECLPGKFPYNAPANVRTRRCLKSCLRSFGLKCRSIRSLDELPPLPQPPGQADEPDEEQGEVEGVPWKDDGAQHQADDAGADTPGE